MTLIKNNDTVQCCSSWHLQNVAQPKKSHRHRIDRASTATIFGYQTFVISFAFTLILVVCVKRCEANGGSRSTNAPAATDLTLMILFNVGQFGIFILHNAAHNREKEARSRVSSSDRDSSIAGILVADGQSNRRLIMRTGEGPTSRRSRGSHSKTHGTKVWA